MNAVLGELLRDGRDRFSAHYDGRLANHLPMSMIAMDRLGASPARLGAFARGYVARLEPAGPRDPRRDALERALAIDPVATLGDALDGCLASLTAEAFHPLLWSSYALIAGGAGREPDAWDHALDGELAAALANHAAVAAARPDDHVPAPAGADADLDLDEVLRRISALGLGRPHGDTIDARLSAIARDPRFAEEVSRWRVPADPLRALAAAARALYADTRTFTALHAITGVHAARVVWPVLRRPEPAARLLLAAVAACHVESSADAGRGERDDSDDAAPGWDDIAASAIASDDDHAAKFAFACREEASAWSTPEYLGLARDLVRNASRG